MQEGLCLRQALSEESAFGRAVLEVALRFVYAGAGHLQQQVMFETFAVFLHALRQVARRQMAQALHPPIGQVVWQQRQLLRLASIRHFRVKKRGI